VKIERIEMHLVSIPLVRPFETSFGREDTETHIIVKLFADGLTGYGETPVASDPGYAYETIETAWHIQSDFLGPSIIQKEIASVYDFENLTNHIRGHNFAKHGFESAIWHLFSLSENKPLHEMLGGTQKIIKSGVSVGIEATISQLLEQIEKFLEEGYKRIKIKIKPGWDVEPVKAIRRRFGDIPLMVDANSAYSLKDLQVFQQLDEYKLMMIEQPLAYDDLTAHAALQSRIETPICLDESISSVSMAQAAIALSSCKIINIKPARIGGLYKAKVVHDLASEAGMGVWCGGMLEMGIGRAMNIAVCTLPNFIYPGDVSSSKKYFHKDIVTPEILFENGELTAPETPGLGYEPNDDAIKEFCLKSHVMP